MRLPHDWKAIAENMSTILSRTDENLSRVFSLCYNHLPHQLKTCFLYLGSFPEDYEIHVSDLIQLWVAEGFLKSPNETESLEEVGEACLQGLVERNLVLITKKRANGQYKFCVMHELLRDFCRNKAFQHLFFAIDSEMLYPGGVENARRVNVHSYPAYPSIGTYPFNCCKHVRSFLWFCRTYLIANFEDIKWDKYQFLRVFGLHNVEANSIQGAILQMVHLKYLRLSVSDRGLIPSFISVFQNLQTLDIHGMEFCPIILPPQIWKMTQLRHLIITTMVLAPVHLVGAIPTQKLGYMQTLMSVRDFTFTNEAIQMMPNLRKLKAFYSNYGSDHKWESHRLNNLVNLHLLEELKISSYYGPVVPRIVSIQSSFALPLSLRKLSLVRCGLPWNYMTVVGSLPNLQVLRLKDDSFMGEEWETTEGGFRSLKFLLLEWLDLKYWRADKTHFPCLEHLKIRWCSKLEMIPLEIGDISTLKFIDINESKGIEDSAKEIQEEQEDQGNYLLQIRIGHIW